MKNIRLLIILLLTLAGENGNAAAWQAEGALRQLTRDDGLPAGSVFCTMTDHNGQVWMGTSEGICRYNGRQLTSISFSGSGMNQMEVRSLCETADHSVVAIADHKLWRLDVHQEEFECMAVPVHNALCAMTCGQQLLVGCQEGLWVLRPEGDTLVTVDHNPLTHDNEVRHLTIDQKGTIWMVTRYVVYSMHPKTLKTEAHHPNRNMPEKGINGPHSGSGRATVAGNKEQRTVGMDPHNKPGGIHRSNVTHRDRLGSRPRQHPVRGHQRRRRLFGGCSPKTRG